jgi:histidinol-phosphatase (PHP family)
MITQDLHTHSVRDDGQNKLEDMVRAAISAGLTSIGFSGHSPLRTPNEWTIPAKFLPDYRAEGKRLKEAYAGTIDVYCGLEWDLMSEPPAEDYDYIIGSIHHIPLEGIVVNVDNSPEATARYLGEEFGGNADVAAKLYFAQYAVLAAIEQVDIVGHFDLITKFDEQYGFFNPDSPTYRAAALEALKTLIAAGKIFEINTGAISRGYRTTPYPSRALLKAIREFGGEITITSDAHSINAVAYAFDQAEQLALECGFHEIMRLEDGAFVPAGIGE